MPLCEIRVPTYKRPELLKRALKSLISQDFENWKAIIMDDSPEQEAKEIVELFADERLIYSPNPKNLGSAGNIDRAFQSSSIVGGTYACILEDDNWFMPSFLSENIHSLEKNNVNILLRNQEIYLKQDNDFFPTHRTTRGDYLTSKIYQPLELCACTFLCEGISNGGLFWKTSTLSNLQVGNKVKDAGLQEYCRTLQINEKLYFADKPLCYWSEMPISLSLRNPINNRLFARGVQSLRRFLIKKYGQDIIFASKQMAISLNQLDTWELSLIDSLFLSYKFELIQSLELIKRSLKSSARFFLIKDPLDNYFMDISSQ
ncbi:MAG: glycosyltransferase family 2 protein [Nostocales cyanobacterium]|nr:MAG: glycosyltransferase family 2 protein [Nostocales cyanobacterium]TAF14767.1 MAG: glycosyltransferase family 2 protein [Nostocales cyanobacterium]